MLAYSELQEHLEALVADKEGLEAEHEDLRAELQRIQDERAAEMPVGVGWGVRTWSTAAG